MNIKRKKFFKSFIGIPTEDYVAPNGGQGFLTNTATTGISILPSGDNITTVNDPVSNLPGINLCPPYLAVNFVIAYE